MTSECQESLAPAQHDRGEAQIFQAFRNTHHGGSLHHVAAMIHLACQVGNLAGVKTVLYWSKSRRVHESALPDGRCPIHVACEHGHVEVVDLLFSHYEACSGSTDSSITTVPLPGSSLVHSINLQNKWTPLHYACASGNVGLVQNLIELHGANVFKTSRSPHHLTPLDVAAKGGHRPVVEYLVQQAGALLNGLHPDGSKNSNDHSNRTPLDLACLHGHVDVALFLLEQGATVTAQTLHWGADHGAILLRALIKQLPIGLESSKLLSSRQDDHSLLDYDWLRERGLLNAKGWDEIGQNHRHWRSWNLLALLLHRLYYCDEQASSAGLRPPLYQLSNQIDAKVRVQRRKVPARQSLDGTATIISDSSSDDTISTAKSDGSTVGLDRDTQEVPAAIASTENTDNIEYEEVEEIVEFEVTQAKDFCWMLHAAASLPQPPADVLTLLSRLFPAQLRAKRRGLTPLLLVCRQPNTNAAAVMALLERDPCSAGIRENTILSRLPLTHALLHQQPTLVISLLLRTYPPAILELGDCGWNALQLTALHGDLGTLFWLLRSSPNMCDDFARIWNRYQYSLS